jgi:hypothetical protein
MPPGGLADSPLRMKQPTSQQSLASPTQSAIITLPLADSPTTSLFAAVRPIGKAGAEVGEAGARPLSLVGAGPARHWPVQSLPPMNGAGRMHSAL